MKKKIMQFLIAKYLFEKSGGGGKPHQDQRPSGVALCSVRTRLASKLLLGAIWNGTQHKVHVASGKNKRVKPV